MIENEEMIKEIVKEGKEVVGKEFTGLSENLKTNFKRILHPKTHE